MSPAEIAALLALPPRAHEAIRRWAEEHPGPGVQVMRWGGETYVDTFFTITAADYEDRKDGRQGAIRAWCPCDTADLMGIAAKLADSDLWWMERTWDAVRCFAGHPPGAVTGDTPRLAALRLIGAVCG